MFLSVRRCAEHKDFSIPSSHSGWILIMLVQYGRSQQEEVAVCYYNDFFIKVKERNKLEMQGDRKIICD